jgi:carotenoid cleavage dioxygenase-like enzyme
LTSHSYLTGNFAPIQRTLQLTPCTYTGRIPTELAGGQYIRNGGNPVQNEELGREAHWFDGDGMLCGVLFQRSVEGKGEIIPQFVNQYILTDCLLSSISSPTLKSPILPSIATLVNPASSLLWIIWRVIRTLFLVILSHLPGSKQAVERISVANTALFYHDGRALATCESGPPIRVQLPSLETVGWFNGHQADGENESEKLKEAGFGGSGLMSFMNEWTTGHPKVDPETKELLLYHCTFAAPYVHYSIIPTHIQDEEGQILPSGQKMLNVPIPGISGAKMMHDFGVSRQHTVILDLPLSLDPFNLMKNKPVVAYDSSKPSRFGIFPRTNPNAIRWYETTACCTFHTANTWDDMDTQGTTTSVNMLTCRLTSASLVFSAGNIAAPQPTRKTVERVKKKISFFEKYDYDQIYSHHDDPSDFRPQNLSLRDDAYDVALDLESSYLERTPLLSKHSPVVEVDPDDEEEQCRLYYYKFSLSEDTGNTITHQYALSAIPFEFPTVNPSFEMSAARYIYGCSTSSSSFGAALGRAVKVDIVVKIDCLSLIDKSARDTPRSVTGCVDTRPLSQILIDNETNPFDPVRAFKMPKGWFAQEARFVSSSNPESEDDGYLLFYAFNEDQLDEDGECFDAAVSELWVLDAKGMRDIICRVTLSQRVPYGLHGKFFSEEEIAGQRGVEKFRSMPALEEERKGVFGRIRDWSIGFVG